MKSKLVGAGLVAGATWVAYNWLRRPESLKSNYLDAPTKGLIVGGGFGGWPRRGNWRVRSAGAKTRAWLCWIGSTTRSSGR